MSELVPGAFPFPLADPRPEPVMITRPCGCIFWITEDDGQPAQISWCVDHDPGYTPPEKVGFSMCERCGGVAELPATLCGPCAEEGK